MFLLSAFVVFGPVFAVSFFLSSFCCLFGLLCLREKRCGGFRGAPLFCCCAFCWVSVGYFGSVFVSPSLRRVSFVVPSCVRTVLVRFLFRFLVFWLCVLWFFAAPFFAYVFLCISVFCLAAPFFMPCHALSCIFVLSYVCLDMS